MLWNPNLHDHLVTDANVIVRGQIADHSQLPDVAALVLARDPSDAVREIIAHRNGIGQAALEILIDDPTPAVRRALAYAKANDVPAWVLEHLALDADSDVRWQVAYNWRTPKATLQRLERDSDEAVRSAARHSLEQAHR
jgi:hypothetical protein